MDSVPRACAGCGASFGPHHPLQRYCSPTCYPKHGPVVACEQCGKPFRTTGYRDNERFCSVGCHNTFQNKRPTFICAHCGRTCVAGQGYNKKTKVRYCSERCYGLARRTHPANYICQYCGDPFWRKENKCQGSRTSAGDKHLFCSRRCSFASRRLNMRPQATRNSALYDAWRIAVIERDVVCRDCGATEDLHAHHLLSWEDWPAQRYDLDNGLLVCWECHKARHPERGVGPRVHTRPPRPRLLKYCLDCNKVLGHRNTSGLCVLHAAQDRARRQGDSHARSAEDGAA